MTNMNHLPKEVQDLINHLKAMGGDVEVKIIGLEMAKDAPENTTKDDPMSEHRNPTPDAVKNLAGRICSDLVPLYFAASSIGFKTEALTIARSGALLSRLAQAEVTEDGKLLVTPPAVL